MSKPYTLFEASVYLLVMCTWTFALLSCWACCDGGPRLSPEAAAKILPWAIGGVFFLIMASTALLVRRLG